MSAPWGREWVEYMVRATLREHCPDEGGDEAADVADVILASLPQHPVIKAAEAWADVDADNDTAGLLATAALLSAVDAMRGGGGA